MTRWRFQLRAGIDGAVDASEIRRSRLVGLNASEIPLIRLSHQGHEVALGELFDFRCDRDHQDGILVEGQDLRAVHGLAAAHDQGEFQVRGGAGDFLGCGMTGGTVSVVGDVGKEVGGALKSRKSGMAGGTIVVDGNCGDCLGHRMRRGTIAVSGDVGEMAAAAMVAGTLIVGGRAGRNLAVGMRRGTVALVTCPADFQRDDAGEGESAMRFSWPVRCQDSFFNLYADPSVRSILDPLRESVLMRVRADRTINGIGEVIFPENGG